MKQEAERRQRVARDEFAWALRSGCRPVDARLRAVVAAVWWTLGSPWHAQAVASGELSPTLGQLRAIVDSVLRTGSTDPLLGAVAAELGETSNGGVPAPSDLDRRLRIALRTPGYNRVEEPFEDMGMSPMRTFTRCLVAWFRRELTDDDRALVSRIGAFLWSIDTRAAIRFRALELLTRPGPAVDETQWLDLVERSTTEVADTSWTATENPYDRSVDLALHYLRGDPESHLAILERHRAAALEYPLIAEGVSREPRADTLAEERQLLQESRGLRLLTQLQRLPPSLTRASVDIPTEGIPAVSQFFDERHSWTDTDTAITELRRIRQRLAAIRTDLVIDLSDNGMDAGPADELDVFASALAAPARCRDAPIAVPRENDTTVRESTAEGSQDLRVAESGESAIARPDTPTSAWADLPEHGFRPVVDVAIPTATEARNTTEEESMAEASLDAVMAEISERAVALAERPSPSWADLAEHAVLEMPDLGIAPAAELAVPGRDAGSLTYTIARLGFAARGAECAYFGANEANPALTNLLAQLHSSGAADSWVEIVWRTAVAMIENADKNPWAPDVAPVLAPQGVGHEARRRLADLVVDSVLRSERGRPWELGYVSKETLARCWRFGYYLAACDASLPPGARHELETLAS
ncbi:MAG: hypothetical protein JO372_05480 [Solirubrobacterales bacterium]|nr:hypothetical protein [Solirubrobacterales bacterium]